MDTAHPLIGALRLEGAHAFDPVRFHYIEVLARRASTFEGNVRRVLDTKLEAAAVALRQRLQQAQGDAQSLITQPDADNHRETLGDLVRHMAQHSPENAASRGNAPTPTPRTELKSVTYFRNTWSRLSAGKQLSQALGQAPQNAGPINSHVVALRALALMRDTSPDYLSRFMSYVDTLMCLDQSDRAAPPAAKAPRAVKPKPKN